MKLYHRTKPETARTILREGFKDNVGSYMTDRLWSGVWLSDRPLDVNDGGLGNELLLEVVVRASETELAQFEWIEDGKTYREWLIPAAFLDPRMTVRIVNEDEAI